MAHPVPQWSNKKYKKIMDYGKRRRRRRRGSKKAHGEKGVHKGGRNDEFERKKWNEMRRNEGRKGGEKEKG